VIDTLRKCTPSSIADSPDNSPDSSLRDSYSGQQGGAGENKENYCDDEGNVDAITHSYLMLTQKRYMGDFDP